MIPIKQRMLDLSNFTPVFEDLFNYNNISEIDQNWIRLPNEISVVGAGSSNTLSNSDSMSNPVWWRADILGIAGGILSTESYRIEYDSNNQDSYGEKPYFSSGIVMNKILPFGAFDIWAKVPASSDAWPAVWLYNTDIEIDIMDTNGNPARSLSSIFHAWFNKPGRNIDFTANPPAMEWPAYWVVDTNITSAPNWDYSAQYKQGDTVYYEEDGHNGHYYRCRIDDYLSTPGGPTVTGATLGAKAISVKTYKLAGDAFSDSSHRYSLVWTPDCLSFFLDGRELFTLSTDYAIGGTTDRVYRTVWSITEFFLDLSWIGGATSSGDRLEIDSVHIYKSNNIANYAPLEDFPTFPHLSLSPTALQTPVGANRVPPYLDVVIGRDTDPTRIYPNLLHTDYYLSTKAATFTESIKDGFSTGENHFIELGRVSKTSPQTIKPNEICLMPDGAKVYYIGEDNRMYNYTQIQPLNPTRDYAHGVLIDNIWNVGSKVAALAGSVFYHGKDDGCVYRFYWTSGGWQNERLTTDVVQIVGKLHPRDNGHRVYFLRDDEKVYNYYKNSAGWHLDRLTNDKIDCVGDIQVTENTNRVYYHDEKSNQIFNYYYSNGWIHTPLPSPPVNISRGFRLHPLGGQIFFRGEDGRLYNYYWSNISTKIYPNGHWVCASLDYNVTNVADVLGSIQVATEGRKVFYLGTNGLIFQFYWNDNNGWQRTLVGSPVDRPYRQELVCNPQGNFLYYRSSNNQVSVYFIDEIDNQWKNVELIYTDEKKWPGDIITFAGTETSNIEYGYNLPSTSPLNYFFPPISLSVTDDGHTFFLDALGKLWRTYPVSNTDPQKRDESKPFKYIFLPS